MRTLPFAALAICLCSTAPFSEIGTRPSEEKIMQHASGPFDVKLTPQPDPELDPQLGRFRLDKHYHGDLDGTSQGQMLYASTHVEGSQVGVAIEKVTGTLKGRKGSFILYHSGVMTRGSGPWSIAILPDSGTDGLTGITGKMNVIIAEGGKHSYELEYTLPDSH